MDTQEAIDQVNAAIFAPGWRISAQPASSLWPTEIVVIVFLDVFDTSYPSPDGEYRVPKTLGGMPHIIDVQHLNEETLACKLYDIIRDIRDHEDRETLRFRQSDGSFKAPLHPHTPRCDQTWVRWNELGVRELVAA
jgi:hypothetical protein